MTDKSHNHSVVSGRFAHRWLKSQAQVSFTLILGPSPNGTASVSCFGHSWALWMPTGSSICSSLCLCCGAQFCGGSSRLHAEASGQCPCPVGPMLLSPPALGLTVGHCTVEHTQSSRICSLNILEELTFFFF